MTIELDQLETLRVWLEDNRVDYLGAVNTLRDPDSVRGLFKALMQKTQHVMVFDPYKHPPEAAVAEVIRMQERLAGVFRDIDFLEQYEDKKEEYSKLIRAAAGPPGEDSPIESPLSE